MFDLPQPLGPTTPTSCPGTWKLVGSTNDLNPDNLMEDRRASQAKNARAAGRGRPLSASAQAPCYTGSAGQVRPPHWENILQIQAGAGAGSNRTAASMDTPARIAMLRSQIKGLLKKIHTLRKALMEATDPKERLAIMKQIIDMQAQVSMAEAQIAELQLRAKRRGQPLPEPAPTPEEQDKWRDKWEDAYASPAGGSKQAVLFVCMGNICRSPTAEGVFRQRA
eukprot:gene43307-53766_t